MKLKWNDKTTESANAANFTKILGSGYFAVDSILLLRPFCVDRSCVFK